MQQRVQLVAIIRGSDDMVVIVVGTLVVVAVAVVVAVPAPNSH